MYVGSIVGLSLTKKSPLDRSVGLVKSKNMLPIITHLNNLGEGITLFDIG